MGDEIEMTRRNIATNANPERNRRPRVQVNPLEEDAPPNREPFDPLTILVPVTDAILILFGVIIAISCVMSLCTGILGLLRMHDVISEFLFYNYIIISARYLFCKYVQFHPELCPLWV